ncbi:uncharacterized protein LOC123509924 [Portunus trituberculatus]|uniref:uncharacterized protein LOC123509924 n=1 Tax=Portunus trituberculatus TaxID=210409 RepID=UPI001E1CCF67|nr:uncharacterized protein LOC123509924 [Portunus trituberculatus]
MSYISDILKHGEAANLSSAEIGRLVQLATEREDRAFAEKERADCEERVKERAHELALAEGQKPALVSGTSRPLEEATRPRVPPFTDGDSYLTRFGKVAQFHHWRDEDLALHLCSLLKGKALKVYVGLPPEISESYPDLKVALLKAFHADADSYRRQFRNLKAQCEESCLQFLSRLELTLKRWLALSEVAEDYKSLFDFVVRDQFLNSCTPDVQVFPKEKGSISNADLAKAADVYRAAHGTKYVKPLKWDGKSDITKSTVGNNNDSFPKGQYTPKCYLCGKLGHKKPECPELATKSGSKVSFVFGAECKPDGAVVDPNGSVNDQRADTGCSTVMIHPKFLHAGVRQGPHCTVYDYLFGTSSVIPYGGSSTEVQILLWIGSCR